MNARITFLDSQEKALRDFLTSHPRGHERTAIVLFRRLHRPVEGLPDSDRLLAVEIVPFHDEWITDSSPSHVAFELRHLRELFRRCEEDGLVFGFAHNHPTGFPSFSVRDEDNERTLLNALVNRNGPDVHFVSLLWTNDEWQARTRYGRDESSVSTVRHILVLGQPLRMYGYAKTAKGEDTVTARQAAAFGGPFVDILASLRVGFVGSSGTGSPSITLAARAGIAEIVVIDPDKLARNNLNRVRGMRTRDVGNNKATVIQRFVEELGFGTRVVAFNSLIDEDPEALDALASCDIIFGCTDDQIGRQVLNTSLYFYAQPLIDVGLGGRIDVDAAGEPFLRYHHGRVSTILPEYGECLLCQGVISDVGIRTQYARRSNPNISREELRERYLEDGGEHSPGVGPFTSATADFGIATLFDLIRGFRKYPPEVRRDSLRIDFVKMDIRSSERRNDADCPYCGTREFLLRKERYRLNRPSLGLVNAAY